MPVVPKKYAKYLLRMDSIQYGKIGTNQFYALITRIIEITKSMTITLNGNKNSSYQEPLLVNQLLSSLNLKGIPVLVELNGTALRKNDFLSTHINDGSIIEIIQIAAGG